VTIRYDVWLDIKLVLIIPPLDVPEMEDILK
jgi:hypothetical protein